MIGDFFNCAKWILLFGKCAGLMPISGLKSRDTARFTWRSVEAVIYVISVSLHLGQLSLMIYGLMYFKNKITIFNQFVFYIIHLTISLALFRFSQKFHSFLKQVREVEKTLPPMFKPRTMIRRLNRLFIFFIHIGFGEHLLYLINSIYIAWKCSCGDKITVKAYFFSSNYWYFQHFPFSYTMSAIFQVLKFQGGIMFFYGDCVVTLTSMYLRHRFDDFNRLIIDNYGQFQKNFKPSWSELQVHYTRLSKLVAIFDKHLGPTVLVLYTINFLYATVVMYFILWSIIINIGHNTSTVELDDCKIASTYDVIPLAFKIHNVLYLVFRSGVMSYQASEVHISSRRSLMVMHSIPSGTWNTDMKRLMTQIYYSKLGVTGSNFFLITRGVIIAIIAKAITYELVLLQIS